MRTLRIAIVGTGIAARELHWPALRQLKHRYRVVAVCNRTLPKAVAFADLIGLDRGHVYSDYAQVLARPDVDAVVLIVPPQFNRELAEAAARAGKHVIAEKPIANSLADAQAIVDIPTRYGVQALIAENYRYHDFLLKTKKLLADGAIGDLFLLHWQVVSSSGADNKYANTAWRQTPEHPGGFLSDVNVHTVDGLRLLAGEISRVHCLARHVRPWLGGLDTAIFSFTFQSGAIGSLVFALSAATNPPMQLTLYGASGAIEATWSQVTLRRPNHKDVVQGALAKLDSYVKEYEDFYDALVHGAQPKMTAQDALRDLAVILAAVQSAHSGQAVELPGA